MFIHCKLVIVIFVLSLDGQVHTGEIFGGNKAVPHSRRYMVVLERHMPHGRTRYCDGFLLNEDFVMTAAHCKARSYTVFLGAHNLRNCTEIQKVSVKQAFPHNDYNETDYKNDMMLLKLSSKAKTGKNVLPIALADQGDGSLPKSCIVSGWGRSRRNKNYLSAVLREVNVTLINSENCPKEYFYCSEGASGPGEGDFGGPLVCEDGKAYGVVSYASNRRWCAKQIYAYAKIPENGRWINSIMEQNGKL